MSEPAHVILVVEDDPDFGTVLGHMLQALGYGSRVSRDGFEALKAVARVASDRMKRSPVPAETWEAVLALQPDDVEALDALHALYEKSKSWEPLADILERKAQVVEDVEARVEVLQLLGQVRGDRLKDARAAIEVWGRVLELAPGHAKAQEALKRAYVEAQDWDALEAQYAARDAHKDLVQVLETQVGLSADVEVKVALLFRAAALWSEPLGDEDRALRAVERVLQFGHDVFFGFVRQKPEYTLEGGLAGGHCRPVAGLHLAEGDGHRILIRIVEGVSFGCFEQLRVVVFEDIDGRDGLFERADGAACLPAVARATVAVGDKPYAPRMEGMILSSDGSSTMAASARSGPRTAAKVPLPPHSSSMTMCPMRSPLSDTPISLRAASAR